MEAVRTSETSVDNQFTRQYNPEDSSEHHTRRRENLKSHIYNVIISVGAGGSLLGVAS
jgi:cysteine synthase